MKKLILFIAVAIAMVGCNRTKEETVTQKNENVITDSVKTTTSVAKPDARIDDPCDDPLIEELDEIEDFPAVLKWLEDHGQEICDKDLVDCIEYHHRIETKAKFDSLARMHSENTNLSIAIKTYPKTWSQVTTFLNTINCYGDYAGFSFSGTTLSFKKIPTFTTDQTCYSKPFLLGLGKKYSLKSGDVFNFVKTVGNDSLGNTVEKVIFELKVKKALPATGFDYYYYDISDNPSLQIL